MFIALSILALGQVRLAKCSFSVMPQPEPRLKKFQNNLLSGVLFHLFPNRRPAILYILRQQILLGFFSKTLGKTLGKTKTKCLNMNSFPDNQLLFLQHATRVSFQ